MPTWLKELLRRRSPSEQLVVIENKEPSLEERLDRLLNRLGGYRARPVNELEEIISDLDKVLDILEKIISTLENIAGLERARNLRTRLRNHRTRAQNAYEQLKATG